MLASIDKQTILNVIQQLPEDTSVKDAMERLLLITKIEKGCRDADEGRTVSIDRLRGIACNTDIANLREKEDRF